MNIYTIITIVASALAYLIIGKAVSHGARCGHHLGYGEDMPRRRQVKIWFIWWWYVICWTTAYILESVLIMRRNRLDQED